VEAGDRAVVDDPTLLVAPGRVVDAADRELLRVPRDHAVDEPGGIGAGDEVLVEGRDVDERDRLPDRVVLDLVGVVVRARSEVARPFAPLQLAVERCGAGMERSSDGHVGRGCGERYDFGICFSGSTKGSGTIVASRSPSGVSTVRRVPS